MLEFLYCKGVKKEEEKEKRKKRMKSYLTLIVSGVNCGLSFLDFGRNMVVLIKGDLLSNKYKWLILTKTKHNYDYVDVIIHYNKQSCG